MAIVNPRESGRSVTAQTEPRNAGVGLLLSHRRSVLANQGENGVLTLRQRWDNDPETVRRALGMSTEAEYALRARGLTAEQASNIVGMANQQRSNPEVHERGAAADLEQARLQFARWLLDNGKLSEAVPEAGRTASAPRDRDSEEQKAS